MRLTKPDVQPWLVSLNQLPLNLVPAGCLRNRHRMDVGGPKRLCLIPLVVRWNSVLKTVTLPNIVRNPTRQIIYPGKNVNSRNIVLFSRMGTMLINSKLVRLPGYGLRHPGFSKRTTSQPRAFPDEAPPSVSIDFTTHPSFKY